MRIAIIADVHGNYEALTDVFEHIEQQKCDKLISLGDNLGYGPDSEKVIQTLMSHNVTSIIGNHELALIDPEYLKTLNPSPRQSLDIALKSLSAESLSWSKKLQPFIVQHDARFVHGAPPDSITKYVHEVELETAELLELFNSFPEHLCFYGHTHNLEIFTLHNNKIDWQELELGVIPLHKGKRYMVNPGSVGQPRDSLSSHAKYMIWDRIKECLEIHAVPYDVKATMKKLKEQGFPEFNAARLDFF